MKRVLALLGAGAVLCLSSCGQAADPPAQADSTSSLSPTAHTRARTPEETVRAWVRAYNRLARTGDGALVDQLSDPGCAMCRSLTESVEQVLRAGGDYRAGDWVVVKARVAKRHGNTAVVDAAIRANAGWQKAAAGERFTPFSSDRYILEFTIRRWADGTSQVQTLVSLS